MKTFTLTLVCALGGWMILAAQADAQTRAAAVSQLQSTLDASAQTGKFTFIVFYREDSDAARNMFQVARTEAARADRATAVAARLDDPAEQALVEKFGVGRAPMPMTIVVAPNGAVTGLFPKTLTAERIETAIVAPTMMECMKHLQDGKLVFVCLTRAEKAPVPSGVQALQRDPHFKERIATVALRVDDRREERLVQQMKLDAQSVNGPYAVLIAPPGVLVGHFDAQASAEHIAAAIAKAGQCCEDANCRHNQQAGGSAGSRR